MWLTGYFNVASVSPKMDVNSTCYYVQRLNDFYIEVNQIWTISLYLHEEKIEILLGFSV